MSGARVLTTGISAATGACYATLAGLSLSAMAVPVRRFQPLSVVIAVAAVCLAYLAFRAATAGRTDDDTVAAALSRAMAGALLGLLIIGVLLLLFGPITRVFLARALGYPIASFTSTRLLIAAVLLGFGTGFVVRMPKITN